ncbi:MULTISPECIES: hypothetical protein [Methylobacterium]|uniref:Uncharacterized protein n=1 Tax=Methylobacterium radiotolerans TaxID=31998 RepID=A0ABV2NQ80_9HYPH|nr:MULTISPECIES: hypothetical protein [unclassified Methylobacterium]MBP2494624.1 hypothetical protein [Methylobacterium sp. PvP105]MBP2505505.1 hypothetical protein [Methylobacterium sp. PvP109]MCX7330097.1 hypothetical protein [Hyphomicrobiales bacterium]
MRTSDASQDPISWALAARAITGGVALQLDLPGRDLAVAIDMTRDEARAFARAILAAAGDATERTFPHPQIPEA